MWKIKDNLELREHTKSDTKNVIETKYMDRQKQEVELREYVEKNTEIKLFSIKYMEN